MEDSKPNYSIDFLVDKFYSEHTELTKDDKKIRIPPPEILSKDRKTFINNFVKLCESMKRKQNELSSYIAKELQIDTSISGNGILIIHGTYKKNNINKLIEKYVINYVQCPICKQCDTYYSKASKTNYIECNKCKARTAFEMF